MQPIDRSWANDDFDLKLTGNVNECRTPRDIGFARPIASDCICNAPTEVTVYLIHYNSLA